MSLRYLFGPVTGTFADQNLAGPRQQGACLAFGPDGDADVPIRPGDSWEDVRRKFPAGWEPDFLVLNLAYHTVPSCLWRVPLPRLALATDWFLVWHSYRGWLPRCDLVLSDSAGVEALAREGYAARAANLFGCERLFTEAEPPGPAGLRDIDVLFVGNLNPAVQAERAPWLTRLARLGRRYRVQIRTGLFGEAYRRALCRARIVFQFSARGKAGRRAFEAAHAGALLFQEIQNRELPAWFRDRQECVYYRPDDFEELVAYYLEHEEERASLAEAARVRAQACGFEDFWQAEVAEVTRDWAGLRDRAGRPSFADAWLELAGRSWQALGGGRVLDISLIADLERALRQTPDAAPLANLVGCLLWRHGRGRDPVGVLGDVSSGYFRRALAAQPGFALAGLNLAEALDAAGRRPEAIESARRTLEAVVRAPELDSSSLEGMPLCQAFDPFHVGWEQAAWGAGGQARLEARTKRDLIQWKLHTLLAAWTGESAHAYEALVFRPDLPAARASLGEVLLRTGRPQEAVEHYRRAVAGNPLDREAARGAFQALGAAEDAEGRARLCEERRLLARAMPHIIPAERWFTEVRPRGNELVSVVLLCDEHLEQTRRCLEAVLANTRTPYELVVVGQGSGPDTWPYLENLRRRPGPTRVDMIRGDVGRGFARGCNRGLTRGRGPFVALLDNGTVVTPGWLDSLVALFLHDWPHVGIVGPLISDASPPQGVGVDVPGLSELNGFAARRRRAFAGQLLAVPGMSGACLLTRREVLDRVGGLDERFDTARFAAADLCLRLREANLRLLLAQDVFVHHAAAEPEPQSSDGFEVLQKKWGPELSAPYRQGPEPVAPAPTTRPPAATAAVTDGNSGGTVEAPQPGVSLCMIVRNEVANLPECLRTVEGLFTEIVVVDTGSTDGTEEVARRFGARVESFPWVDSFGAARNESVRHARCKWIMWLDADDRLDPENRERLRKVLAGLGDERDAYAIQVRSVLDPSRSTFRLLDQVRIFRNLPEVRWDYRIHEQILPAVNRAGGAVRWTDVIVDHVGYQDAAVRRRKLERNLRLLELDDAERPADSFSLFNFGWTLLDLGRTADALPRLRRSLETARPDSSILRKLHHLLAVAQRQQGTTDEALQACREGLKRFPDDAELLLELGLMLRDRGDFAGAEETWSRLFEPRAGRYFSSEEVGIRGFRTRQLLAEVFARQDRCAEAEVQWRIALDERLDFEPAWQGLAELYLHLAQWDDLERLLQRLEAHGIAPPKVGWLRARGLIQRKDYATARTLLASVIAQDPQALGPRVLLSQALLQEGRDWQAAEKALLAILEIDPANRDANHNLQLLRAQHGRLALKSGGEPQAEQASLQQPA